MAIPFLLPLLFTAGSLAANTIGANKAASAMASVQNAERQRQKQMDEQAYAINDKSRDRFEDFEGKQGDKTSELADYFKGAATSEPTEAMTAAPQSDSNLVVASDAEAASAARARADDSAEKRAAFRSFGDLLGDFGRFGLRDAGELNMLRGFKRGSQSVLPMELEAAQQKGRGWMMLGDLLNVGAGITSPMALTASAPVDAWSGLRTVGSKVGGGGMFGGLSRLY
ncbi:hypothetical protein RZ532_00925 [Nitratireductor aquimarinus]|uniref:hypothetical protein n=1 Tax=Nitratireductor aquimarinus TaxID=889300 RepID=UPI002935CEB3|nr:hypothetical protein [Nitratireductor aquimarinus]MDV2964523.1 hypothetical protein [Nitratireductor aquimarinus]